MSTRTRVLRGIIGSVLMNTATVSLAATVAVIDSGVDYKHSALEHTMWTNPSDSTTDDSGSTYKGDTHGWNFAEGNNQIIDYKYVGTFSQDCYRIVEIQGKILRGIATDEEKAWYKTKKEDPTFLKEMQKFGNFIHGTHVSGISSHESAAAQIVGIKLIPTETPGSKIAVPAVKAGNPMVTMMLGMVAKRQATLLITTGKYTKAVHARVANGSFGTSVTAVKPIVAQLAKQLTGKDPTPEEIDEYALSLVNSMLKECAAFPAAAPNTLFVFASGNDGTNNDQLPTSPANIKADNTIAVAATMGAEKLASFSNFGAKNVEVAAPGVVIRSSIPGGEFLELSGTSMAAPYVTNVAARVQEANPTLAPGAVKKILIDTVDKKDWLVGKVTSGGIVNSHRAVAAAELSNRMPLEQALSQARIEVADEMHARLGIDAETERNLVIMPMPAFFE